MRKQLKRLICLLMYRKIHIQTAQLKEQQADQTAIDELVGNTT